MDLEKGEPCCQDDPTACVYTGRLEPAPWFVEAYEWPPGNRSLYMVRFRPPGWEAPAALTICSGLNKETAEHIALWRNAEDVQTRRWWSTQKLRYRYRGEDVWHVPEAHSVNYRASAASPSVALVEADEWYKKHIDGVNS